MNKAVTLLTLLATTSATAPLSRNSQSTSWFAMFPYYSDNVATDVALITPADHSAYTYVHTGTKYYGGYSCIRKGKIYAHAQTLTTSAPVASTGTIAMYSTSLLLATTTVGGALAAAVTATTTADCATMVGQSLDAGTTPNFGESMYLPVTASAGAIPDGRLVYIGGLAFGVDYIFSNKAKKLTITWNPDFLLAAQHQISTTIAAGATTEYCTQQWTSLAGTTANTAKANIGFGVKSKCTFAQESEAAKGAPQMSLTKAAILAFQMQWAEWDNGALTADTLAVKLADTTPIFGGTVGKTFPNPIKAWDYSGTAFSGVSTMVSGTVEPITDFDPLADGYTMSPGKVMWWPSEKINSVVSTTATSTQDFMKMKAEYDAYTSTSNTYNTALGTYNTNKDAYNKALTDEAARKADFFKSIFDPAVVIPERPCQPTRPNAFVGVDFKYDTTTAITATEKAAMKGTFNQNAGTINVSASFKLGYFLPSAAVTAVTAAAGAAHTYGYFGNGDLQEATTVKAFQWKATTATATHTMMASILPYTFAQTATTATIEISFENKLFDDAQYALSKPAQPSDSSAPDAVGAKALAASTAALAVVAATLF